jgi:hypothetical protein
LTSPLSRAWATLTRYPVLAVIPVLWELITFWLAVGLGGSRYPGAGAGSVDTFTVKLLLPSSMPSGAELIGRATSASIQSITPDTLWPVLIATILGAFVTAGYLHLLSGALQGEAPSWVRLTEGSRRFGPRLLLWNLLVMVVLFVVGVLAAAIAPIALMALLLLALLYLLVPFLIVLHDVPLPEALARAPTALRTHLSRLIPVGLGSVALSIVCSFALTASGLSTLLLASPLWAWLGTWITLGVFAVLQPQDPTL